MWASCSLPPRNVNEAMEGWCLVHYEAQSMVVLPPPHPHHSLSPTTTPNTPSLLSALSWHLAVIKKKKPIQPIYKFTFKAGLLCTSPAPVHWAASPFLLAPKGQSMLTPLGGVLPRSVLLQASSCSSLQTSLSPPALQRVEGDGCCFSYPHRCSASPREMQMSPLDSERSQGRASEKGLV